VAFRTCPGRRPRLAVVRSSSMGGREGGGARTGKHALGGADRRAGEQVSRRLFGSLDSRGRAVSGLSGSALSIRLAARRRALPEEPQSAKGDAGTAQSPSAVGQPRPVLQSWQFWRPGCIPSANGSPRGVQVQSPTQLTPFFLYRIDSLRSHVA
jgi:hypothetical protein